MTFVPRLRGIVRLAAVLAVATVLGTAVPAIALDDPPVPHYLLFTGTYGFRHDGIAEEAAWLALEAERSGAFTVETTGDPSVFKPSLYDRVDGVMLLQTTGLGGSSSPLSPEQQADFIDFFGCGGSLAAFHAAADSGGGWPEYDELLGSYGFDFHPHLSLESRENPLGRQAFNPALVSDVTIQVPDQVHMATKPWHGFPSFRITDEIYKWKGDPKADPKLNVLLTLDEESHYWRSEIGAGPSAGGLAPDVPNPVSNPVNTIPPLSFPDDSPIAWTKTFGDGTHDGRVFYTNLGHNMATWERADFQLHVKNGIAWASQTGPDRSCVAEQIGS